MHPFFYVDTLSQNPSKESSRGRVSAWKGGKQGAGAGGVARLTPADARLRFREKQEEKHNVRVALTPYLQAEQDFRYILR